MWEVKNKSGLIVRWDLLQQLPHSLLWIEGLWIWCWQWCAEHWHWEGRRNCFYCTQNLSSKPREIRKRKCLSKMPSCGVRCWKSASCGKSKLRFLEKLISLEGLETVHPGECEGGKSRSVPIHVIPKWGLINYFFNQPTLLRQHDSLGKMCLLNSATILNWLLEKKPKHKKEKCKMYQGGGGGEELTCCLQTLGNINQ